MNNMNSMLQKYEMTVGLEVHVELKTNSKIFCSCPTDFGAEPNTLVCPVCLGLPGTLPVLNRTAVEYAIKAGLACNCTIAASTHTDRKNYFYPDLPKAYQISQLDEPLCRNGYVEIYLGDITKRIGITRIHIEEDAGKLIHLPSGETLIDYNRCGVPLIEIVSEPDIHSPDEAKSYLKALRTLLLYVGVSDCRMNEGSMRCDVNISVSPTGSTEKGVRTEVKNINSFAFAAKAIEAEFIRQTSLLENGGTVDSETLRYNEGTGKTEAMRKKETTADYRFFPEPDLMPIFITENEIAQIYRTLPTLPSELTRKLTEEYGLSRYDSDIITASPALASFFEIAASLTEFKKILANLLLGEALKLSDAESFSIGISPSELAEICTLQGSETINASTAKKLFLRYHQAALNGASLPSPCILSERENLSQINSPDILLPLVRSALDANPRSAEDFKKGKSSALRSIIGSVMSATGGRANPRLTEELILKELN